MKIGIVTTWFERGAAYVSKQFYNALVDQGYEVTIYARGGEHYAKGDANWDWENVYWQKRRSFATAFVERKEFEDWLAKESVDLVIFNEQHYWQPIVWAKEKGVKTVAYIDYYTQNTVELYNLYDAVICNTQRHLSVFENHAKAIFIPWGTDVNTFSPSYSSNKDEVVFFHSCGMSPHRKGTDLLLKAIHHIKTENFKLLVHSQVDLKKALPAFADIIDDLILSGHLKVITKTVTSPGLYYMGDVYVYPSRLEGIGLTIAEAMSVGLPCIVPNNGPMNEFISDNCEQVKVEKFIARADGYYWPECISDIHDLSEKLKKYIQLNRAELNNLKKEVREYSKENLDWHRNTKTLGDELSAVKLTPLSPTLAEKSIKTDNTGRPDFIKYSRLYHQLHSLIKLL